MAKSMSLNLNQKQTQSLKQLQRLMMSRQMQQAIHLLQMPVMELSSAIEGELEQNPLLEYLQEGELNDIDNQQLKEETDEDQQDTNLVPEKELSFDERDFEILRQIDEDFREHFSESGNFTKKTVDQDKLQTFLESSICATTSLYEYLMTQARETFATPGEVAMAEALIGNFDEGGFLKIPLEEIASLNQFDIEKLQGILEIIQTFHPAGIGAADLKQSFLIQLRSQGKSQSLAYAIIEKHFDDLLHNRILLIKKGLRCSTEDISQMIDKHISKLELHPGTRISSQIAPQMIPDVTIRQEGEELLIEMHEDALPPLRLNPRYLKMLDDESVSEETREFIRQKILSAKWLVRNIFQRNDTIERIAQSIAIHQKEFLLNPEGKLVPMTMKSMAEELHVHESTVVRAVSNKSINTPKGILPLRFFFTSALSTQDGDDISSRTVQDVLTNLINREDKQHPLSDEALSTHLKTQGIHCARRTVAKYRAALKIGNTQQRKKYI